MAKARRRNGVPKPPASLTPAAAARWQTVVVELAAKGPVDIDRLTTYCQQWARWQEAETAVSKSGPLIRSAGGRASKNPLITIANDASKQARLLADQLGIGVPADDEESDGLVTRRELAQKLGVHMQTITKWEREGMPIARRGRKGRASLYRVSEVSAWLKARESAAGGGAVVDVARARADKETWQARLAQQAYLARSGELLPRAQVVQIWTAEVLAVRTLIMQTFLTHTDRVFRAGTLEGRAGVERELRNISDWILRALSDPARALPAEGDEGDVPKKAS